MSRGRSKILLVVESLSKRALLSPGKEKYRIEKSKVELRKSIFLAANNYCYCFEWLLVVSVSVDVWLRY
jgi:hypothetical protein